MPSKYPWTISLCDGEALQFLITDVDGDIVLMAEMYSEENLLALLSVFQRNPEIRVDASLFAEKFQARKRQKAREYLDSLPMKVRARLLRENDNDAVKAADAGRAAEIIRVEKDNTEGSS